MDNTKSNTSDMDLPADEFSNGPAEQSPDEEETVEEQEEAAQTDEESDYRVRWNQQPDADHAFAHGHVDGAYEVEREPFERYIDAQSRHKHHDDHLNELAERDEDLRGKESRIIELRGEIAELEEEISHTEERAQSVKAGLEDAANERDSRAEEQEEVGDRGSVIYAFLYSAAGLVFIAGDVVMSREVVANALRLQGDIEPWIFAVALGMLAVLLKPAYDRIAEKPYWEGKKKWFERSIIVAALAAMVTLGILGDFRSVSYQTDLQERRLEREMQTTTDPAELDQIGQQLNQLQQSVAQSWQGRWSFILSGILFAVAGAICLGIGIRHFRDIYRYRWRSPWQKVTDWKSSRKLKKQHRELSDTLKSRQALLSRKKETLEQNPSLDNLRDRIATTGKEREEAAHARSEARREMLTASYEHGYNLALGNYVRRPKQTNGRTDRKKSSGFTSGIRTGGQSSHSDGEDSDRPFVALRRAITSNGVR